MEIKNYGLQFDKIEPEHYFLGSGMIGSQEINPSGQWDDFLPAKEAQRKNNLDTQNCTGFGTLNCLETLYRFLFKDEPNYSDRFTGVVAGTTQSGNSPHNVAEAIRSKGVIPEEDLPFSEDIRSISQYYSPNPMHLDYLRTGKKWLEAIDFKHEWILATTKEDKVRMIKEALKRSPVGMSVAAWTMGDDNKVYVQKHQDNHWVCCYGYDDQLKAWKIFDSYPDTIFNDGDYHKLYSMDSDIAMAKLYYMAQKDPNEAYKSLWQKLFDFIKSFISPTITLSYMKITMFCTAIKNYEGWSIGSRSWRNNNPGNLKFCGQKLSIGRDAQGFAIFAKYEDGWNTLMTMIKNAASGLSKVYNPEMTITQFFSLYAPSSDNNNPDAYAKYVGQSIGADPNTLKLKDLLV